MKETPNYNSTYNSEGYILPSASVMGTPKGASVISELNKNHYGLISWFCHGGTGYGNSGISVLNNGDNQSPPEWKLDAQDSYTYYRDLNHYAVAENNNGLDNLTNSNYPCVLYAISCNVTPFDLTSKNGNERAMNCGEAFTTLSQTGGVAFLGNTRSGYVGCSAEMYKLFIENILEGYFHLGEAEFRSKFKYSDKYFILLPKFMTSEKGF
jgi:hypothetical protein